MLEVGYWGPLRGRKAEKWGVTSSLTESSKTGFKSHNNSPLHPWYCLVYHNIKWSEVLPIDMFWELVYVGRTVSLFTACTASKAMSICTYSLRENGRNVNKWGEMGGNQARKRHSLCNVEMLGCVDESSAAPWLCGCMIPSFLFACQLVYVSLHHG